MPFLSPNQQRQSTEGIGVNAGEILDWEVLVWMQVNIRLSGIGVNAGEILDWEVLVWMQVKY